MVYLELVGRSFISWKYIARDAREKGESGHPILNWVFYPLSRSNKRTLLKFEHTCCFGVWYQRTQTYYTGAQAGFWPYDLPETRNDNPGWCQRHHFWRPEEDSPVLPIHILHYFHLRREHSSFTKVIKIGVTKHFLLSSEPWITIIYLQERLETIYQLIVMFTH